MRPPAQRLDESSVNASATVRPRQPTHSTAGVAATMTAPAPSTSRAILANERLSIAVTSPGNSKTGTFDVTVG